MTLDQKISLPSYIMFQRFDEESVLLDVRTQEHFGLDPVGTLFFQTLQSTQNARDAYQEVLSTYEVDPAQLEADLISLLHTLEKYKLIEVV